MPRLLLVEDNFLAGISLKQMLEDVGCEVSGPVSNVSDARELAQSENFDGGVLDINIVGGCSAPVAESLQDRGCPFFFVTGYRSPAILPDALAEVKRLSKPVDPRELKRALKDVFGLAGNADA